MGVHIDTLSRTDEEELRKVFIDAFSDYQVRVELPAWKFRAMLTRRGYDPALSVGAFDGGTLVGFALGAFRPWEGEPTLYDVATGVVGSHRKKGIAGTLLDEAERLGREHGARRYLLEVLRENEPALKLYRDRGFLFLRTFSCYRMDRSAFLERTDSQSKTTIPGPRFTVEEVPPFEEIDWERCGGFRDFQPSWQNSKASMTAGAADLAFSLARVEDTVAGYGIVDRKTGDIPQFAVAPSFRSGGIGKTLLVDLAKRTEGTTLGFLNVEDGPDSLHRFLQGLGFKVEVSQFELGKVL